MTIYLYEDFIPYSIEDLDEKISFLENLTESISIKKKDGKIKIGGSVGRQLKLIKKLLKFLFIKKKKLKQQGKDTSQVIKKIDRLKKKLT